MVKWLWWFLILEYMEWPFVLQFSSSPLDFDSSPIWVPALVRSISMTLRQIWFLQCSSYGGRFRWPWGKFIFCSALLGRGRFRWPWDTLILILVTFLFVVDFVDFEVVIYFLQCASFGGVDRFDPEARIWFLQCAYFNRVDFIDPEARDCFLQWITLWHPDSGLFGNCCCR